MATSSTKLMLLAVVSLLITAITVNGQSFSLGSQTYPNHGLVTRDDIGTSTSDPDNRLHCVSDDMNCCSGGSQFRGEFDFPDESQVPVLNDQQNGYYRNRDLDRIYLNRLSTGTIQGLFRCRIVTSQTSAVSPEQLYIGVYDANSGSPSITSLEYDDTARTLTCMTTGGPATTITWRRNCVAIDLASPGVNFTQTVTDQAAATYMNVLTLPSPVEDGSYSCTVSNARGSDTAMVQVGSPPVVVTVTRSPLVLGSSHTLTCSFTGAMNSPTVQWRNGADGMLLTTGGDVTVTDTAPYELTFNQLRESHLGDYYCEVKDGGDEGCSIERVAQSVSVVVAGGTATAGTSHNLTCTVSGVDLSVSGTTAMYTWSRGSNMLSSTTSLYTIDSVGVSDAGDDYQCDVTVMASYLDVTGSVSASGTGSLNVQLPLPSQVTLLATPPALHYTGLNVVLTCQVVSPTAITGIMADIQFTNPMGMVITNDSRIMIQSMSEHLGGTFYRRTVQFMPLSASVDTGSYTCSGAFVPLQQNNFVMNSSAVPSAQLSLAVTDPSLTVSAMTMDMRVLDIEPYNNFTIMCMAVSSFNGVNKNIRKTITWTRTVDSGQEETLTDSPGSITITNDDLTLATSTSTLLVATTTAGQHMYTCSSQLVVTPAMDVITDTAQQTVSVIGPAAPMPVTGVMVINLGDDTATIQFTVTSLTYDPETYVVQYGASMGNLNETSSMETSGTDLDRTSFTLTIALMNLVPSTEYFYRVVATNSDSSTNTPSGQPLSFTTTARAPDPPTNLAVMGVVNDTTITLSWTAPVNTFGVLISNVLTCQPVIQELSEVSVNVSGSLTSATVSGLENGARYDCSVMAQNEAGLSSEASAPFRIMAAEIAPDGPPQNFEIVPQTPGRNVQFSWTPPLLLNRNGDIINYNLTCVSGGSVVTANYSTAGTYVLNGFKAVTVYMCSVYAENSAGIGPPDSLTVTTREDVPDGPPLNIQGSGVDGMPGQVSISWQPPQLELRNGEITGYRINCPGSTPATTNQLNTIVSVQRAATRYTCLVAAATDVGPGVSGSVEVLSVPNQPVVDVEGQNRSLLVTWTDNTGTEIDGYQVFQDGMMIQDVASAQRRFTITNLDPFSNHSVAVLAYNRFNGRVQVGPQSDSVSATTLQDFSSAPVNQGNRWDSASPSSVSVSWTAPEEPNGLILRYMVELVSPEGQVIRSANTTMLTFTFSGLTLDEGALYVVRIFAVNMAGFGQPQAIMGFGNQQPPGENVFTGISVNRTLSGTAVNLTWTVLPLDQVKGFVTIIVEFESSSRKRQAGDGCTASGCRIPYEQGGVVIRGFEANQRVSLTIRTENGEGEGGVSRALTSESTVASPSDPTAIIAAIIVVVVLIIVATIVIIIVVVVVKKRRSKSYPASSRWSKSPEGDIKLEERKLEEFRHSGTSSPAPPDEPQPSPVASPEIHEADRLQPIQVEYFGEHVKSMHENRDKRFEREYESLPNDTTIPASTAANNKPKNRFANIHPYDFSRVKISAVEGVDGSDYINASYIDGYNRPNAYIAAQGPMPNTIGDFWRMIWEYRLSTIVMLTKVTEGGKRKCEPYWPDNVHDVYNPPNTPLSVSFEELQPFADYEIKKLVVTNPSDPQSSPLTVTHYHFLGWPDHGVPQFATSLIAFIRRVRSKYHKGAPPMLVHCSAGVGRTGTFIVLDTMLERMQHENTVNVYEFLRSMRAKRIQMVQTQAQYVFIHDALDELVTCGDTSIASHNLRMKIGNLGKIVAGKIITGFQHQFELLNQVSRQINNKDCSDALQHYNSSKNRYQDRIPFNTNRVRLRPTGVTGAEYINASFVDGYKKRNAYIAAQAPLESTVNDFWRMIWEFKSKCIVMLCDLTEQGKVSCSAYWPTVEDAPAHYGKLIVTLKSEKQDQEFVIRKFEITEDKTQSAFSNDKAAASFTVTQFHFSGWAEQGRPDTATGILQMSESVNSVQRSTGNKPITVLCNDGIGRSGTFICIHAQLERVKTEGVVDAFQFVKSSRISRPNLVSELEYYIFCHHTLADFLDTFDTYANFKDLGTANL